MMVRKKKKTDIIALSCLPKNNEFIPKKKSAGADLKSQCKITGWFSMACHVCFVFHYYSHFVNYNLF